MSSKEKKGFKRISKKFLSSFRKDKKLQDISELHDDPSDTLNLAHISQNDVSLNIKPESGSSNSAGKDKDKAQHEVLTLSPHKSSKSHFKRILNRASFSNVRSIAKEHPDLLRNITSPRAGIRDLGGSRSTSTDSGIDCSVILSEKSTPEKFVQFSRREAERLRQDFINESTLETVTEVDSRSSIEEELDESRNVASALTENVENESLEEQINQTKEQIEVLTELKTVLSGKLKEFDSTSGASPQLDDENYVVMTPPNASSAKNRSNKLGRKQQGSQETNDSYHNSYFVDMYTNKTDEIKVEETRLRNENHLTNNSQYRGDPGHKIVDPIPVQSANIASHKTLPSTPAPASLFSNENSAFAKKRTVKRSVSDVSKGLFGKLRSKKKDSSSNIVSKDDCATADTRKKNNQIITKSLKKNRSFSFDGEHDVSLDYLDSSVSFKSLDDHTSIVEDIESINPIVENGSLKSRKSPIGQEAPIQTVGSISELTDGLCEMTSALCTSQGNSAESIACICDCKNRTSNTDICEVHRNSPVDDKNNSRKLPETVSHPADVIFEETGKTSRKPYESKLSKEKTQVKSKSAVPNKVLIKKSDNQKKSKKDPNSLSENEIKGKSATEKFNLDILNKSISPTKDKEALYVNVVRKPTDNKDIKISKVDNAGLIGSYSDSDDDASDCDCCDWCAQGCDCSHSDTECSDPNCTECISEFSSRSQYGTISSSCDSLSENDGCSLDKSVIQPYPNWVNSSDEGSSGSQTSQHAKLSNLNKSMVDEPSPEPVRFTKFDSSPNSINSFNMDSSFSVSFREVDFENGEVMYKLDSSLNESLQSSERQESPNSRHRHGSMNINPSHTPASSPCVTNNEPQKYGVNKMNGDRKHQIREQKTVDYQVNSSLPMNLSFNRNNSIQHSPINHSHNIRIGESPLNLNSYGRNSGLESLYASESKYNSKIVNRSFRKERQSFTRGKPLGNSLLSRSLNESQLLQDYENSRRHDIKYSHHEPLQHVIDRKRQTSVKFNQSLNESVVDFHKRDNLASARYPEMLRPPELSSRRRMSRSFTDGVNQSSLNSSFFMDTSQNPIGDSPLDLSVSKPMNNYSAMSPKPLDLSMSRVCSPADIRSKQARWVNRHVGQIYSPAKRVLHKNQGLSEKDLCKQILDIYVSDTDETLYEPEPLLDTTMESSVLCGSASNLHAEDSMLQYGTYLAPRHVVKETNVDDFTTTVRTCYTGEAKTRKIPADCYDTKPERSRRKSDSSRKPRSDRHKESRSGNSSHSRPAEKLNETQTILNQSAEHIYEEIPSFLGQRPVLKDRTNTLKKKSSLKKSPLARQEDESVDKKKKKDMKEMSEKSFDRLTLLHTAHNGQRKVKCLSMDESIHVVKHYPPPKEATRISWGQTLSELELWRHTPRKSPVKTNSILTQKENTYPYEDDTPSPIVLTKMRKPKTFNQKYKNWPWS